MTLSYISEKHKIAFADAFEAMACSIPSTSKEVVLEKKEFDQKGRLIERHLIYYEKRSMLEIYNYNLPLAKECYDEEEISKENENRTPLMDEHYDYEKGVVHKSFYECGSKILQITFPLYSKQELRAKHMPIKEWVQRLGFTPEQVTEINLNIKSTDKIGGIQQETIHGCEGYFKKAYRTNIRKSAYDEKGNIYAIEEFESSWGERRIESRTFDVRGNLIFQGDAWNRDAIDCIQVSLYDSKSRAIQHIDTSRYGWFIRGITYYTYKGNEMIRTKIYLYKPKEIAEESSKLKKGDKTIETFCTEDDHRGKKEVTTFNSTGKIIKKTETNYLVKYKNWIGEKKVRSDEITNKTVQECTYNEAGVLVKEVSRYVNKYNEDFSWPDGSYSTEIILYNEQGQKVEYNKKREYKNCLVTIGERPNLKIERKDKIFLEHTLYYYDSEGNLTREELKKWRADEGIETDVELLTIHHFYEREEEYEAHLEITVKNNL